ncbi:hypothetical protein AA906_05045 [Geobacillus stearothermophilus]|nr:hypothetical protein AA906_05045 [Geobacillus stearothermophilus]
MDTPEGPKSLDKSTFLEGGLKWQGSTAVLTSNGYGTTGVPLRLGAPAETHLITIVPGKPTPEKKCLSKTGKTM